jgi:hypothetical protein
MVPSDGLQRRLKLSFKSRNETLAQSHSQGRKIFTSGSLQCHFEGARRFLRAAVFPVRFAVRGLDVFFAFLVFAFFAFFADFASFPVFAFLAAVAFRALAFALLSARTFAARASSSSKGSASVAATTLHGSQVITLQARA